MTCKENLLFKQGPLLFIFIVGMLALFACEPFQPLQNNDEFTFSIYGYLDASIDTQWVRVTPLREQIDMRQEKPEMHVTLEHLESGNTVVMNDSLLQLKQGLYALNVWTAMEIRPGQSYRLRAERPDGAASQVTITIPEDFPTPILKTGEGGLSGNLLIKGVDRLADVQTVWRLSGRVASVPYRSNISNTASNEYTVSLSFDRDLWYLYERIGRDTPPVITMVDVPRQVFVASAGPEWNEEIVSMNDLVYNLPKSFSNVEGGVGYLVGIVSKTIPFKGCFNEQGENIACPEEEPFFR